MAASGLPHRRALDGVRGAAVLAVLLFHAGHLEGGFLGVDLFFVLSGFLITSLLLAEMRGTARVGLLAFWARRARRLLPALFLLLAGVALYAWLVADPQELHRIRGDAWATLAYVANWRFILSGFDYFALFTAPSPLNHTWSLAIEEQFYVLWPLVMVAVLAWGRMRNRTDPAATSRRTFVVSAVLAVLFTGLALALWRTGHDPTRVYYGTDTRAPSILIGAALGAFLTWRGPARAVWLRRMVEGAAVAGVAVLAVAWVRLSGENVYRGGLLVCAVAGAAVIAAAAHPEPGPVARVLGVAPLVGLGLISYGVYLYHWPIYLWLDEARTGLDGAPLLALRLAVTLAVALVSYRFVEQPIRRGAFSARTLRWLTPVAAALLIATMVITTAGYRSPAPAAQAGITDPVVAARQARRHPGAQRVMVVGNSVAYYLGGEGFTPLGRERNFVTLNGGSPACIFPRSERVRFADYGNGIVSGPCDDVWSDQLHTFRPDLVILTFSDTGGDQMLHDGHWIAPCDPAYRDWYLGALEQRVSEMQAVGARVVLTTSAYAAHYGATKAERIPTDCTNALIREFARTHPGVELVDLERFVCPSTTALCRYMIGNVEMRPDGVHYRHTSARRVARWILDQIDRAPVAGVGATPTSG
jgi:peptidoglycan/LPS O-acetylase OafA/YrhL